MPMPGSARFFAFSDVHGSADALSVVVRSMSRRAASSTAILCPGDYTAHFATHFSSDVWQSQATGQRAQDPSLDLIASICGPLGLPFVFVPGNHDPPNPLLRQGTYNVDLLAGHPPVTLGGVHITGVGGAPVLTWREEDVKPILMAAAKRLRGADIVLLHSPPHCTGLDVQHVVGRAFHRGSPLLHAFLEVVRPRLALCGHIHQATGVEVLGDTLLVNLGTLVQRLPLAWPPSLARADDGWPPRPVYTYWEFTLTPSTVSLFQHGLCAQPRLPVESRNWFFNGRQLHEDGLENELPEVVWPE